MEGGGGNSTSWGKGRDRGEGVPGSSVSPTHTRMHDMTPMRMHGMTHTHIAISAYVWHDSHVYA